METTTNYKLPQWVKADQIKMDDFNDAFGKIDAQMKKNADTTANGLTTEAAARQNAAAAVKNELTAAMGTTGYNCRAVLGSYTGTGTGGSDSPCVVATGFTPLVLILVTNKATHVRIRKADGTVSDNDFVSGSTQNQMTWASDRVSWYNGVTSSPAEYQANVRNVVYYYLVLGYDAAANE